MAQPPAGWHPDPLTRHAQRYWDGNQWTEHVADQSGNMSTDPLDGGQSPSQQGQADQTQQADQSSSQWGQADSTDQGGWGQSDTGTTADTGTMDDTGTTADTGPSWGSSDQSATAATDTTADTDATADTGSSWGSGDQAAATDTPADTPADTGGDTATSWDADQSASSSWGGTADADATGTDTTAATDATDGGDGQPSWQSSNTQDADATAEWSQPADTTPTDTTADTTEATDEPAWGSGAGAAGAAAAAGSVAASDPDRSAPVDDQPGTGDSIKHVETGSTTASDADVSHPTIAVVTVGIGVVVRNGHVLAASSGLAMADSEHPGATSVTGDGTVHVGADGRQITVLDVPASGLTIADDALVAHSAGLTRAAAADGIVGYDGTSVTGGGWVAIAAVGGAVEVSPVGGIDVTPAALVAWSSDLDVSHAENVNLSGRGTVLVSSVTS